MGPVPFKHLMVVRVKLNLGHDGAEPRPLQSHFKPTDARPKGTTGTKWSANREKIVALRMAYPLMTPAEMAEQLGITADAVRKLLREFKEAAATAIAKKHG